MFRCEHILAVKHYILAKPIPPEHRRPDGAIIGKAGEVVAEETTDYAINLKALKLRLINVSSIAAKLLGHPACENATYRIGMPEALLETLQQCGDAEAARLACETFLERLGQSGAAS